MEKHLRNRRNAFLIAANYFLGYYLFYPAILMSIALSINPKLSAVPTSFQWIAYIGVLGSTLYLFWNPLVSDFQAFLQNRKNLLKKILHLATAMFVVSFVFSSFIAWLTQTSSSQNQAMISEQFAKMPALMLFVTLVFAPMVEEIVFRGVIFQTVRTKWSFFPAALLSALLFGLIHTSFSASMHWSEGLYVLVYAALGFLMCKAYEDTSNFWAAYALHFVNNLFAVLLLIL